MQENIYSGEFKGLFTRGNYKTKLHEVINALYAKVKTRPMQETIDDVRLLTDAYIEETGERPEVIALERMATLILNEEITDKNEHKMSHNEYPIMSDTQQDYRYDREVSLTWAEEVGSDGIDYRPQTRDNNRKMRAVLNGNLRDKDARARNKERRKRYREFTKVQPVITYRLPPQA